MAKEMNMIFDERPIRAVYWGIGDQEECWTVDTGNVSEIVAYFEQSFCPPRPWVAIYVDEDLRFRRDLSGATVHYFEPLESEVGAEGGEG